MEFTGERLVVDGKECDENSIIFKEHVERYKLASQFIKNLKVLDIACGTGLGSNMLAEAGAQEVWGGDLSSEAVGEARDKYHNEKVHFRVMDALKIPFEDDYFDVLISFETIEHVEDYKGFIDEIYRVLKPGGKLLLSTPNSVATQRLGINNQFHIKEFNVEELKDLLKNKFNIIDLFGQRVLAKMSITQKVLQKLYFIYRKIVILQFLSRLVSDRSKNMIGHEIAGLTDEVKIEKMQTYKDYLYLIIQAEEKR